MGWSQCQVEGAVWGKRPRLGTRTVEGRVQYREGTQQAFLFPLVTSWQITRLQGPSSGDIQQGRAGPGLPGGPRCQLEGLGTAPCWPSALGAGFCSALPRRGHADRQGRARAGLFWAKDQGSWLG